MTGQITCPVCNGPMWDNRGRKLHANEPDFRCKKKPNCPGKIDTLEAAAPAYQGQTPQTVVQTPPRPSAPRTTPEGPLVTLYEETFKRLLAFHNTIDVADGLAPNGDTIATIAEKMAVTIWMSK